MTKQIVPPGYHTVRQGEWLGNIAKTYGFTDWHTIWNDANNVDLKGRRSPNILMPDDILYIPAFETKSHSGATEQRHRFQIKKQKTMFRTRLIDSEQKPRPNVPYQLTVGDEVFSGSTKEDGSLGYPIPIDTEIMFLEFDGEKIPIKLGHLDPIEEASGVQARLRNLSYFGADPGPIENTYNPATVEAIKQFQKDYGLKVDGICGPITRDKLRKVYGC